jgi:3-oxoacyl-[acyl-carrier protein] reductase
MKKLVTTALIAVLIVSMTISVSAAKMFTDFENYKSFNHGENLVFGTGEAGDYWIGNWNDGAAQENSYAEIVEGKGVNGSKALKISSDATENVGLYLFATDANQISKDYSGTKYLRVWMDMSEGVGFRKANYGTTDSTYSLFTTDEENANSAEWPFYYMADGSDKWEKMLHGSDGCFGDAQESDVFEFKGYFAFPVEDFVIRDGVNWEALDANSQAPINDVTGIYLFWDYAEFLVGGDAFYIDDLEFVEDYTSFPAPPAPEPAPEPVPEPEPAPAPEAEIPAETAPAQTPAQTTAPETADLSIIQLTIILTAAIFIIAKLKSQKVS